MPLNGAIVKKDATGITVVAGTDQTFSNDGAVINNGVHLVDAGQADFRLRRTLTFKVKQPTYGAVSGYSKDRKGITLTCPKLLADGSTSFNLIRMEREVHPETTAAEQADINRVGAQLLSDADFDSFWSVGSLL
jgi:hypothetical protein